jgi:hypothetical protein
MTEIKNTWSPWDLQYWYHLNWVCIIYGWNSFEKVYLYITSKIWDPELFEEQLKDVNLDEIIGDES